MNIVHINDHARLVGGAERVVHAITAAQAARGHRCWLVHSEPEFGGDLEEADCVPVEKLDRPGWADARRSTENVLHTVRSIKADVVHMHNVESPLLTASLHVAAPTIRMLHGHALWCPGNAKHWWWWQRPCPVRCGVGCFIHAYLQRCASRRPWTLYARHRQCVNGLRAARRLECVVVASDYMKREAVLAGLPADRVEVAPLFTWLPGVEAQERDIDILFSGRLVPHKGAHILLEAVRSVPEPMRIAVVGDGPQRPALERMCVQGGLVDRVTFHGWLSPRQVAELYARSRVLCAPSLWPEPFGLVGPEAMAHGTPVVASSVGGIVEWLDDGKTGLLFPPGDVTALADRLRRLLRDRSLWDACSREGVRVAGERYSLTRHVDRLESIYEMSIERWRRRRRNSR